MEDFVTYEVAKKLKEKGYKELCFGYYINNDILRLNFSHKAGTNYSDCLLSHNLMPEGSVSGKFVDAPTISQVLTWLREEKNIHLDIGLYLYCYGFDVMQINPKRKLAWSGTKEFTTYESAALAGIEYVLDNLI